MTPHGHYRTYLDGCRCDICAGRLPHGTGTGYSMWRCRCDVCREANRRRQGEYELRRHRGISPWGDREKVAAHIRQLVADGLTYNAIAKAGGYRSHSHIDHILGVKKITKATERRILAIKPTQVPPGMLVTAIGARRRLKALARMGWSCDAIADRVHCDPRTLRSILGGWQQKSRKSVVDKIAQFYDTHSMTMGPSIQARVQAERKQWPPPLAWDDHDLDDPKGQARAFARIKR